jgi:flagellar hook-length control protein FliK
MLLNSLLTNSNSKSNILDLPNQIKNNKPTYLFSDIIRMISSNQSESGNSNFNTVSSNTSTTNFTDMLGENISVSNSNKDAATLNDLFPNNPGAPNTVSAANLQNFLNDLFNRLSSLGFSLKNIKGIQSQTINANNTNLSQGQDQTCINNLQTELNKEVPLLLNISVQNDGNESKNGLNIDSKKNNQVSKTDSQGNVNLNQVIFNILQSNRPVILNFNFANQPVQIEISKSGNETVSGTKSNIENNNPEKFISNLLDQISNGSLQYQNISSISNTENHVLLAGPFTNKDISSTKLNGTENLSLDIANAANIQPDTFKEAINKEAIPAGAENQTVSESSSGNNTSKNLNNNQFKITAASGNKNSSLTGIQDLEQFLAKLSISNNSDSRLVNPQIKLFYDLNNWKIKNVSQNIDNSSVDSGSLIKNHNTQDNVSAVENSFPKYIPDLFQAKSPVVDKNSFLNEIKKDILDSKKISLTSAPQKDSSEKILQKDGNLRNSSDEELIANSVNLNKKEVIAENKIANQTQSNDISNLQSKPVDKLAGVVQTSKQTSNDGSENKPISDGKITTNISAPDKSNHIISTSTNTSSGDNGKRSDTGKRQNDDALISSAQALNADKQSVGKNNFDQNVKQFNDIYKTVQASDLITEISHFIGQGQSKSIELKLKPEDLGKVKIALEVVDKVVHANIEVENESVKQMVQTNINNLKQSLSQNGLQLSNLSVSISGGEAKSNKSFVQKKRTNQTLYNKKIDTASDLVSSKSMGYNTYEYLI